jgi:hypothetical protein
VIVLDVGLNAVKTLFLRLRMEDRSVLRNAISIGNGRRVGNFLGGSVCMSVLNEWRSVAED